MYMLCVCVCLLVSWSLCTDKHSLRPTVVLIFDPLILNTLILFTTQPTRFFSSLLVFFIIFFAIFIVLEQS